MEQNRTTVRIEQVVDDDRTTVECVESWADSGDVVLKLGGVLAQAILKAVSFRDDCPVVVAQLIVFMQDHLDLEWEDADRDLDFMALVEKAVEDEQKRRDLLCSAIRQSG